MTSPSQPGQPRDPDPARPHRDGEKPQEEHGSQQERAEQPDQASGGELPASQPQPQPQPAGPEQLAATRPPADPRPSAPGQPPRPADADAASRGEPGSPAPEPPGEPGPATAPATDPGPETEPGPQPTAPSGTVAPGVGTAATGSAGGPPPPPPAASGPFAAPGHPAPSSFRHKLQSVSPAQLRALAAIGGGVLLVIIILVVLLASSGGGPKATVDDYLSAIADRDMGTAVAYQCDGSHGFVAADDVERPAAELDELYGEFAWEVDSEQVTGDTAQVTLTATGTGSIDGPFELELKRRDGDWLVCEKRAKGGYESVN